jgi:hypothetical protein
MIFVRESGSLYTGLVRIPARAVLIFGVENMVFLFDRDSYADRMPFLERFRQHLTPNDQLIFRHVLQVLDQKEV